MHVGAGILLCACWCECVVACMPVCACCCRHFDACVSERASLFLCVGACGLLHACMWINFYLFVGACMLSVFASLCMCVSC